MFIKLWFESVGADELVLAVIFWFSDSGCVLSFYVS